MVDHPDAPVPELATLIAAWSSALDRVGEQVVEGWPELDDALTNATSEDVHVRTLAQLESVRARGAQAIDTLADLIHKVEGLLAEWHAARRYDNVAVKRLAAELNAKLAADDPTAAQDWLSEVFDALDAWEWEALELLTAVQWPPDLADGGRFISGALKRWGEQDHSAGLALMERLGRAKLDGWQGVLDPELRSRAYRLAAWVALRRLKQPSLAEQHLSTALALWPHAGRMHAERAAYYLSTGDLDRAATDAQRSVELAREDAAGYIELGIWAELSGDFDDADQFYRKALVLLPTVDVARLGTRVALMDPPGRLLTRAAEVMLAASRPKDALRLAEQALHADQRGPELHPQAAAHRARSLALERIKGRSASEAGTAAVEAGRLYAWNGDVAMAIECFERAEALDDAIGDVGWLLADARLTTSLPLGARKTDQKVVAQALETWERWTAKVGPPRGATSWAYLTRAMIADLGTQQLEANRLAGIWEALLYVEKAMLHDEVDAPRWGYLAQYLRYVHLDDLALEAADRGYQLGSGDRQVLAEQLAQLAYRGRFEEADHVADQLVTMFGNDPWVSAARAWLSIHSKHETRFADGLGLLELPLEGGNDPSWYYEMRALCHAGLDQLDAAREAFRGMLRDALPVDGTTKSRLEVAATALGDGQQAAHWSSEAAKDPTSRPVTRLTADAFAAFAREEPEVAAALLSQAAESARSIVELSDICDTTRLLLRLLPGDDDTTREYERAVAAVADGPVRAREQPLTAMKPCAGDELDEALATATGDDAALPIMRVALLAIKARRQAQDGRLSEAATTYQKLVASSFEPEATLGLANTLRRLASEQAAAGDVERVQQLTKRMRELGHVSRADVATTVASAMERSGSRSQAREQLVSAIATAANDRDRAKLHQRAGTLALADDDIEDALAHFQAALEAARDIQAHGRAGQVHIRLALIDIRRDDLVDACEHLVAAARAWKDGGALDPTAAIVGELHGLERLSGGRWEDAAEAALELLEKAIAKTGAPKELEPLRRELGLR